MEEPRAEGAVACLRLKQKRKVREQEKGNPDCQKETLGRRRAYGKTGKDWAKVINKLRRLGHRNSWATALGACLKIEKRQYHDKWRALGRRNV